MTADKPKPTRALLLLIGTLGGILAVAVAMVVGVMHAMDGVAMSIHGWIAMGLGIVFTLGLGGGLMALVFYSARRGYDEAAASGEGPDDLPSSRQG